MMGDVSLYAECVALVDKENAGWPVARQEDRQGKKKEEEVEKKKVFYQGEKSFSSLQAEYAPASLQVTNLCQVAIVDHELYALNKERKRKCESQTAEPSQTRSHEKCPREIVVIGVKSSCWMHCRPNMSRCCGHRITLVMDKEKPEDSPSPPEPNKKLISSKKLRRYKPYNNILIYLIDRQLGRARKDMDLLEWVSTIT
ncbi:hypothetical protein STEG23_012034 [Scotinomys teguina]